ncbi:MAG TPA: NADH-quinone oxidoreductase subunit J [Flavobacteriaceae bacterium]|nr:NADH-quinone oxidoreductase subunit J [Flavobacteriaceae bacterium]
MTTVFYIAAIIAIFSTLRVVTHKNAVHALLYMVVSLLSFAVIFFLFGAPFPAALEIIIYAGAIIILFIFVAMMLNFGSKEANEREKKWISPSDWWAPGLLSLILLGEFIYLFTAGGEVTTIELYPISPKEVGTALYTKYILGVELVAMLLMSAAIGAYHLGKHKRKEYHRFLKGDNNEEN